MKRQFLALMLTLGVAGAANAQFGGLGGLGKSGGGGDVGALIDKFNADNALIREATAYSLLQIVAALGDKTQVATIKASNDSLTKTTDAKEKGSIEGTVIKEQTAVAKQLLESQEGKDRMQKLAPEMQQKVAKSILAVATAALKIPGMLDTGKKAIEGGMSNPLQATKLLPIKDGVTMFAETLPKMVDIGKVGFQMLRDVKVEAGNPSADAKLTADKNVSIPE